MWVFTYPHVGVHVPLCAVACINIYICTLKIPNSGTHTIVWTHRNTAHTGRNGWRCSCGCYALPRYGDLNLLQGSLTVDCDPQALHDVDLAGAMFHCTLQSVAVCVSEHGELDRSYVPPVRCSLWLCVSEHDITAPAD